MKRFFIRCGVVGLTAFALATSAVKAATVTVFAAASLTDALTEIGKAYEAGSTDKVVFNFEASSVLARQIEAGSPADLCFSADEVKMDGLARKGFIATDTRRTLLSNTLVIVVPTNSLLTIHSASDLTNATVKKIAFADPKGVPAGMYAKSYLVKQRLWDVMSGKVVPTENVRAALVAVESENVEAGIVYKTDAAISQKVRVAFEIPASNGPAISYPVAMIKESQRPAAAKNFLAYLESPAAATVFTRYGFKTLK